MRGLLAALFFVALGAQAQEYDARSEFTFCKLNEGKNLMDVMAQSERYGEFSKEAGTAVPAGGTDTDARGGEQPI